MRQKKIKTLISKVIFSKNICIFVASERRKCPDKFHQFPRKDYREYMVFGDKIWL